MSLLARVRGKLRATWFALRNRSRFAHLGRSAHLFGPYRIDGARGISLGDGSTLQSGGWLYCVSPDARPARLRIGGGCTLGYNNHITCVREVTLGDHVLTANNVHISDNAHEYRDVHTPVMHQPVVFRRAVHIGDGAWLGENACVFASVGRNSVIGANSVVTEDVPDFCVAAGAPARIVSRFDSSSGEWLKTTGS